MDQCNIKRGTQKEQLGKLFVEFVTNMVLLCPWVSVLYLKFLNKGCILKRKCVWGVGGHYLKKQVLVNVLKSFFLKN